ncbi:MAG: hypothetical protein K8R88_11805 [Armatimonadetes bacterium]|nr:hypothetical protein [Armatimonadota bacterium]
MFAQLYDPKNFWQVNQAIFDPKVFLGLGVGFLFFFFCMQAPPQWRKHILWAVTFFCGLIYILEYLLPGAVNRQPGDLPANAMESVRFLVDDSLVHVGRFSNVLTAFLIGLGTYALVRLHTTRVAKKQTDWQFSLVLLSCFLLMLTFGFADYHYRLLDPKFEAQINWNGWLYGFDFLFDGLFQQMDATMFSVIAFFILSASYRAFRIRSVESTILLATALVLILSQMGVLTGWSDGIIDGMTNNNPDNFLNNFKITIIAGWIKDYIQSPSLRAINFGIAIGALAMGLRLWLGLEKGGGNV